MQSAARRAHVDLREKSDHGASASSGGAFKVRKAHLHGFLEDKFSTFCGKLPPWQKNQPQERAVVMTMRAQGSPIRPPADVRTLEFNGQGKENMVTAFRRRGSISPENENAIFFISNSEKKLLLSYHV